MFARVTFWLLASVYAMTWVWHALTLPDQVPAHYDWSGHVDRWGTKTEHLAGMAVLGLLVVGCFDVLPRRLASMPTGLIAVPNPSFWTRPEHRAALQRMVATDLHIIGSAALTLLILLQVTAARAGGSNPGAVFPLALGGFTTFLLGWTVWVHAGPRYRPPT